MSFAPYQPAPDDPAQPIGKGKQKSRLARPWFPTQASGSSSYNVNVNAHTNTNTSYQSGAVPTFGAAVSGQGTGNGTGSGSGGEGGNQNQWETRFSWRVDAVAAWVYLLGPISALVILILETTNDYIRFHAYQSALAISPLYILNLILGLSRAPLWLRWVYCILEYLFISYLAWRAYRDANQGGLARYRLPWIGDLADAWVGEE
ncbi:hypothetical protein DACRYDRAFT_22436 [Dacryopinax primogenitus]|uniref:Uncharacterized protein n=1 Tax=Dacryopinax primogenitus (strain DJM 731) TaxID=1858805 RepID=M5G858_DACPD|nr:uncharacterized protein DACRYDRAFT_22436 [Dacryopinax primogenitus]EJU02052.1 hypothetical protein DACRYDRAFT_22436 [Dacryopinax primogenitus]